VPASNPIGVPAATAIPLISTLPKMAFANPPGEPGAGVFSVNTLQDRLENPL